MANVKPIPEGYNTITPSICFRDTGRAIEFYKNALGAKERMRMPGPDGKIMHAEIEIGNSVVMLNDEIMDKRSAESIGDSPAGFYVYVEKVDAAYQKAISAGGKEVMPPADMFWGDRMSAFKDPFGYTWNLATHIKDLTPEQIKKGQEEWMRQMASSR